MFYIGVEVIVVWVGPAKNGVTQKYLDGPDTAATQFY